MTLFQQDFTRLRFGAAVKSVRAAIAYGIFVSVIQAVQETDPEHCFTAVALTPTDNGFVGPAFRVTDIWNGDGVCACLRDVGTVCDHEWMSGAVEAYAAVGYDVVKVSDERKPFKGFSGATKAHGSCRVLLLSRLSTTVRSCLASWKPMSLMTKFLHLVKMIGESKCVVGVSGPEIKFSG